MGEVRQLCRAGSWTNFGRSRRLHQNLRNDHGLGLVYKKSKTYEVDVLHGGQGEGIDHSRSRILDSNYVRRRYVRRFMTRSTQEPSNGSLFNGYIICQGSKVRTWGRRLCWMPIYGTGSYGRICFISTQKNRDAAARWRVFVCYLAMASRIQPETIRLGQRNIYRLNFIEYDSDEPKPGRPRRVFRDVSGDAMRDARLISGGTQHKGKSVCTTTATTRRPSWYPGILSGCDKADVVQQVTPMIPILCWGIRGSCACQIKRCVSTFAAPDRFAPRNRE